MSKEINELTIKDLHLFIGRKIRFFRKKQKLSQEILAEQAGMSSKYLGEVERGIVNISIEKLYSISLVLKTPLAHFVAFQESLNIEEDMQIKEINDLLLELSSKDIQIVYNILKAFINKV